MKKIAGKGTQHKKQEPVKCYPKFQPLTFQAHAFGKHTRQIMIKVKF